MSDATTRPVDRLLECLDAVRPTAPDRWIARCPAHDDRNPSLNIREKPDGMVLLRCEVLTPCCTHLITRGINR